LQPEVAEQLRRCGTLTLADLRQRIQVGGRWWSVLRSFGPVKAKRLAQHVDVLLGPESKPAWGLARVGVDLRALDGSTGANRAPVAAVGVDAKNDRDAVRAWVAARVGSTHTAKQYEREAERFMLWCVKERGKALSDANAQDCRAYMDFLACVPVEWISRVKAGRFAPGWAPFKGQLSLASQGLAIAALHSLFSWLVAARYLGSNPWVLVNRKLGDDPHRNIDEPTSRAFTPLAWAALHANLDQAPQGASTARLRWLCLFVEGTGLRAHELISARCSDLRETADGWLLSVHGKGRRNRTIPVPGSALAATRNYFAFRGFSLQTAPEDAPLMASLTDALKPISYSALHETFTRFVRRSLGSIAAEERRTAQKASAHWLRHTHATRAAERLVPPDVLQENLGQSDPRTTARYYRAQLKRRQAELQRAFG
jgi:integrase